MTYVITIVLAMNMMLTLGCGKDREPRVSRTEEHRAESTADDVSSSGTDESESLQCAEHGVAEAECGICHPELAEGLRPGEGLKIRFPSTASAAKAGIESTPVTGNQAIDFVSAMGRLELNQNAVAKVASPVDGQVLRVLVDLGQHVQHGERLVEINSPAWGEALAEEKAAEAALMREEALHRERVSSTQDLEEARARYERARALRQAAGPSVITSSKASGKSGDPQLSLLSPISGTVVARSTSVGEVAVPGNVLIEIADLDPLWAMLSVSEASARLLKTGDSVDLQAGSSHLASGRIEWIADVVDPTTRMVHVRAVVPNPAHSLRAGTFVNAQVRTGRSAEGILVPANATARFGGKPFVFLELEADLYEVRRIELAGEENGFVAVVAGLHSGDRVVSRQAYLVKSEFQKSRLGAGCVD